jgi:cyclopropane-fatty-acyl-phospholipid synthase
MTSVVTISSMTVAETLRPVIRAFLGADPPLRMRCWDSSTLGPDHSPATLVVHSPTALRRLLWAPNELGLGRAYVAGELDIEGDVYTALNLRDLVAEQDRQARVSLGMGGWADAVRAARTLGVLGPPAPTPPEEARLRGRRHSKERDAAAVAHHYDISNDFYRLVLGPTLTYSCAYFTTPDAGLDEAQEAKYELICRKLGLQPGMRLLDVGCGWGGMLLHAARAYDVRGVGVTLSSRQAELASKRVAEAGLADRIEIRKQDYRDIDDGPYDAISSIGMFEHVGLAKLGEYFAKLHSLLRPGGRLLNHGISRPSGPSSFDRHSFIERYVFPDGEVHEVGSVVSALQANTLEVRDVHSLREHYARTLRHWVANLQANWDEAVRVTGEARARIWLLYMAGSAMNFEAGRTSIHQVLAVKAEPDGSSGMPLTRDEWAVPGLASA